LSYWPFASAYAAKQRERLALKDTPLMKFGRNVVVKKRVSCNRIVKGFEQVGQVAKYLGPLRNSHEGHYVLLENQKILKTTRIVPYDLLDDAAEDKELKELGWTWTTDPEGRTFYQNKNTGEKSWETPLRLQEDDDQTTPVVVKERRRLNGKQPPQAILKEMKLKRFEIEEDEAEVSKTISLHDVYKDLERWRDSLKSELESQYGKECLMPVKLSEADKIAEQLKAKLKVLPTKLVAVKKKKPNEPVKNKARIVTTMKAKTKRTLTLEVRMQQQ
jgi:hypothetical protein